METWLIILIIATFPIWLPCLIVLVTVVLALWGAILTALAGWE